MDRTPNPEPQTGPDQTANPTQNRTNRWMLAGLIFAGLLTAGLVIAPMTLSAQDVMDWARTGLNLKAGWPLVVVYALDATALIAVVICFHAAWTGQRSGLFQIMVWVVAGISGFAQYQHGDRTREDAPDGWWFFPVMAMLAPFMLELVLGRLRALQLANRGQAAKQRPKFGLGSWIPGVGSFTETYGAWRTARLLNLSGYDEAVRQYRTLCPDGGLKVLKAIRAKQQADRTEPGPGNWKIVDRTPKQVHQASEPVQQISNPRPDQTTKPVRRKVNLYENPDQVYIAAILDHPAWPETSLTDIQRLVKSKCPTGMCGKPRAIRLRDKAKETS